MSHVSDGRLSVSDLNIGLGRTRRLVGFYQSGLCGTSRRVGGVLSGGISV